MRVERITWFEPSLVSQLDLYNQEVVKELGLKACDRLVRLSDRAWRVFDDDGWLLMILGVQPGSLISARPELWFMLGEAFKLPLRFNMKEFRSLTPHLLHYYPVLRAGVDCEFKSGCRFAEFFGFREIGLMGGYRLFEARREWLRQ